MIYRGPDFFASYDLAPPHPFSRQYARPARRDKGETEKERQLADGR